VSRVHSLLLVGLVVLSGFGCAEDAPRHEASVAATASTPSITLTDQVVEAGWPSACSAWTGPAVRPRSR
jgi:hypothetical protein